MTTTSPETPPGVKVKICGITTIEDALAACEAGADLLGFNFCEEARKRGRYIECGTARMIAGRLPRSVKTVAVCVNETAEQLMRYLEFLDLVQLHGEEPPALCGLVADRAIKAFRAGTGFDPQAMCAYPAVMYLVDAHVPGSRGGTGHTCDWNMAARAVAIGHPIMLAGGLTPENVADAVRRVRPYAVDVAGGVESSPGKKDAKKMWSFISNAKNALSISR